MEQLNLPQFSKFSDSFKKLYAQTNPKILEIEGIAPHNLDFSDTAENYFRAQYLADVSIDANANVNEGRSFGNFIGELIKSPLKLLGYHDLHKKLSEIYGQDKADAILKAIFEGDIYFHDSTAIHIPYCWAYSSAFLLDQGNWWGQLQSLPPRHAKSFIDQVKEVTIEIAQQIAGAVAIADLFVCYSYFVQKEKMDLTNPVVRKEIENDFQSLVHTLNKKLRPSHQSPFTNVSIFDRANLEALFGEMRFPNGSTPNFDIVEEVQKIFCDWFSKGDPLSGLPYRFPVVTLNLKADENHNIIDQKALEYYSKINLEKGCFNIYISSGNKIASCCRLVNDFDLAGCDSFGNGGVSLGSHRVVTINMARIGHKAKNLEMIWPLLKEQLDQARDALIAHRKMLEEKIKGGFLPFFNLGIMSMSRLFSTFGINGIYECLEEVGISILNEDGQKIAQELLEKIRIYASECTKTCGTPFNIEQVPAESLAIKFAEKDRLLVDSDYEIYSNQFVPLWVDCDIVDRIKIDGNFSKVLTGGGISHLNIGEKLTSPNQMRCLIEYAVKCGCEHFAINYNFCCCENKHITISGPSQNCPICGAKIVEQYTRIIGYWTPVSAWNKGRRSEHKKRIFKGHEDVDAANTNLSTQEGVQINNPENVKHA